MKFEIFIEITKSNLEIVANTMVDSQASRIDSNSEINGSGWAIKQFLSFELISYETKPARASSYIPTPAPFNNPKCGLINIKNSDNECFKWCMKYHQSKKEKNDDRITNLSKIEDKYNYDDLTYPASYDNISNFESKNNVCVFIYSIGANNKIIKEKDGEIRFFQSGCSISAENIRW